MLKVPSNLYVKQVKGKGYGVFSSEDISKGSVIETCYCIKVGSQQSPEIMDYAFNYPKGKLLPEAELVLPLGFGCIYNHDEDNNADWQNSVRPYHFNFVALRDIKAHEEICTYYGSTYWEQLEERKENNVI